MRAERVVSITTADGQRHTVSQTRHPSRSYGRMFHTVFDDALEAIAARVRNGSTLRLFLLLPRLLSFTDWRRLNQVAVAEKLGCNDSSISRAMAELLALGAVEKRGTGAHIEWRLSPDWGWRGDVDSYHAAQRQRGRLAPAAPPPRTIAAEGILWKFITWPPSKPLSRRSLPYSIRPGKRRGKHRRNREPGQHDADPDAVRPVQTLRRRHGGGRP